MQAEFWHDRWRSDKIGFHESQVNRALVAHLGALAVPEGGRVFLPLCGKTLDIDWLLARGYRVAGAELSPIAVAQLFERLGVPPVRKSTGALEHFSAAGLDVFAGDIFLLTAADLGAVDAVYDRAALVALPREMRQRYAQHLRALTDGAPQLLVTLEYDPECMQGPPFPVGSAEVRELYGPGHSEPTLLASHDVPGGMKGCATTENVWLLRAPGISPIASMRGRARQ